MHVILLQSYNTQQYCQMYISSSEENNILAWKWLQYIQTKYVAGINNVK